MIDTKQLMEGWLPKEWLKWFDLTEIKELEKEWQIMLTEKENLVPGKLKGKEVVQNGYMNPIEIEDFPLRGKKTFLKFFRRRWKEQGKNESYFNEYDFHPEGMKATREFGAFLKEFDRGEADLFFGNWPGSAK
jgi:hypothetical protein